VLMASVPEASAVVPGARGPRGPVKVDRPVGLMHMAQVWLRLAATQPKEVEKDEAD
jgi:hypothetical protein